MALSIFIHYGISRMSVARCHIPDETCQWGGNADVGNLSASRGIYRQWSMFITE